jgi:glycosyltransferase involved in cell wall biosynthesis
MSDQRPRVAILADWWWPESVGGAEHADRATARALAREAEVAVFVPAVRGKVYQDGPLTVYAVRRPFARRVHADTRARRGIEFLTAWLLPATAWRLRRHIRRFNPDVAVATNVSRTGPWLLRAIRGVSFVRVYHDLSDTCWRRSRLKGSTICAEICRECRVKAWALRTAAPRDGTSVCVSGFVQTELVAAGLTSRQASLVAHPVLDDPGRPAPPLPSEGGDELTIGYIGRISPVKGIESAIRTVAAYQRRTGKSVSLLVAGEGQASYVRSLVDLAAAESVKAEFAGFMDVDEFCARASAVLIPSRWMEPFGLVPAQVGRRGRPMLISQVGGLPEAAEASGGRFAFADFQDPVSAAEALVRLLDSWTVGSDERSSTRGQVPVSLQDGVGAAVHQLLVERHARVTS